MIILALTLRSTPAWTAKLGLQCCACVTSVVAGLVKRTTCVSLTCHRVTVASAKTAFLPRVQPTPSPRRSGRVRSDEARWSGALPANSAGTAKCALPSRWMAVRLWYVRPTDTVSDASTNNDASPPALAPDSVRCDVPAVSTKSSARCRSRLAQSTCSPAPRRSRPRRTANDGAVRMTVSDVDDASYCPNQPLGHDTLAPNGVPT